MFEPDARCGSDAGLNRDCSVPDGSPLFSSPALNGHRHGSRHASLPIAEGLNVVFVSRQLRHANPSITLEVYAHLFERADHADAAKEALETSYAAMASRRER